MRVFITGATGLIGRAAVLRLRRDGHQLTAWVRSPVRARGLLGAEVETIDARGGPAAMREAVSRADAVLNLAGEPIIGKRWTKQRKAQLLDSRVGLTRQLVRAMEDVPVRPRVLLSGSAVGYYGSRGSERLDESSAPGSDFAAQLCREWEAAALDASRLGVRVAVLRIGLVLGRDGGFLDSLLPVFRAGIGGPIGDGRGYVPWIHLWDVVDAIALALTDERFAGPLNLTAPQPATWREFATALGSVLHRPAALPVPPPALRALYGEAASAITSSQNAIPARLQALGFRFTFAVLEEALRQVLTTPMQISRVARGSGPRSGYLDRRRASHLLSSDSRLQLGREEVFSFFCRPENLGLMTPSTMSFDIQKVPEAMGQGARIDYRLRIGPVPLRWRTHIEQWVPGEGFVDSQEQGPYRAWWHEHRFVEEGPSRTRMEDRVYYSAPFGILGRLAQRFFIAPQLRKIFGYRADAIRLRFGGEPAVTEAEPSR